MRIFYSTGVRLYGLIASVISPFNQKARAWVDGRKNWKERYTDQLQGLQGAVWMHCASLGEFEQGRPVLEAIRKKHPERKIVLSFFSPSGYEMRKDWDGADAVIYLPLDTASNARFLVSLIRPSIAIWVKYEFWFNHFSALQEAKVPLILISGVFRNDQSFFRPWGAWMRRQMRAISRAFVQDEISLSLARKLDLDVVLAGDTRFDRVVDLAEHARSVEPVRQFVNGKPCLVLGSSWPREEQLIANFLKENDQDLKVVLVPHEIGEEHLRSIDRMFGEKAIRYSDYKPGVNSGHQVLVIDQIGLLGRIYKEADVVVIGGGFGAGIHNTLEAAVYGKPLIFGPRYHKFNEARGLIASGAAFSIDDQKAFDERLKKLLQDQELRQSAGQAAATYVKSHGGATEAILTEVGPYLR